MKSVLAALELDDKELPVVEQAAALAAACQAKLCLLHIEQPNPDFVGYEPGPQFIRDQVAQQTQEHLSRLHQHRDALRTQGLEVECHIIQGPTVEKLVDQAIRLDCQYMVVGARGHGFLHELIWGSVSEDLIRKAPCPVLVVPREQPV